MYLACVHRVKVNIEAQGLGEIRAFGLSRPIKLLMTNWNQNGAYYEEANAWDL